MPYTTVRAATVRAESLKMMSPFTPTPSLADPQEFTDPDAPVAAAPTPAGAIHAAEGLCDVGARVLDEFEMARPWWADLKGDALHWYLQMPEPGEFFIANVARVLLHVAFSEEA